MEISQYLHIHNIFLYVDSLPKPVIRRVKALKKLQFDMIQMESKFYEEVHQLECKYAELYAPILEKVQLIIILFFSLCHCCCVDCNLTLL